MLGLNEEEALKMYEDYWNAVPPLKQLKEVLENYWKQVGGKQFIRAIDGRKLNSRSAHSLLNLLFQGNGAILSKWSVVKIAQTLEKQGLLGDPFKDDPKECNKVFQMIVYHK